MANKIGVKINNILAVVQEIHGRPGVSKSQIGEQLELAPSTVHGIVNHLESVGVLCGLADARSTGGRKAQRYQINSSHRRIAAVSVHAQHIEIGILDLALNFLHKKTSALSFHNMGPQTYVGAVAHEVLELIKDSGFSYGQFAGVGVCLPAIIDVETGTVQDLQGLDLWRNFPIQKRLSDLTQLPVLVQKKAHAELQCLEYTGQVGQDETALYIDIYNHISAAFISAGTVLKGASGLAGEIGHMTVRRDGARCYCGNTGCLDLYCSNVGILAQYKAQSGQICKDIDNLLERAREADEVATKVLVQAVRYLTEMLSHLMLNYDPDKILINCAWLYSQQALYHGLLDGVFAKNVFTQQHKTEISLLQIADLGMKSAAAGVAVQYLFSVDSPFMQINVEG